MHMEHIEFARSLCSHVPCACSSQTALAVELSQPSETY